MPDVARRRGTVAEPRAPSAGGGPAPRDGVSRSWRSWNQPSDAPRARLALALQVGEVVVEVDLHGVALRGDVAREHPRALALDVAQHRLPRRQRVAALEQV